jgi:hypothetical protein
MERKDSGNNVRAARGQSRNKESSDSWLLTPDSFASSPPSFTSCERETELVEALTSGRWPDACGEDLRRHAATCVVCADVVVVARALEQESAQARVEMALPAAGLVWWKAQMRARREAAERAAQPIAIVEGLAWVCGVLCLLGTAIWQRRWIEKWLGWFAQTTQSSHFAWSSLWSQGLRTGPWSLALIMVLGAGLVVSALVYAVLADR